MLKMLICLTAAVVLGGMTLQLRQQRMELGHDTSQLNDRINAQQAKLWSQQLQIAVYTAPNAIQQTVKNHDLKMVAQSPQRSKKANWIDATANPDAE
jgi:cell division protein FtsL